MSPQPTTQRTWVDLPASKALFWMVAASMLVWLSSIDRTYLLDQQAYVDYFAEALHGEWWDNYFGAAKSLPAMVIAVFSEEFLWRIWTAVLALVFEPRHAVLCTVLVMNVMVVLACARLERPAVALLLWIVLPVGLAVIGIIQIRQGFGLAVMLYIVLRWKRPVLAALIAAMIHTTFVLAFVFAVVAVVVRFNTRLVLLSSAAVGFGGAVAGAAIFALFGGRRATEYSVSEGATSLNYVLAAVICVLPACERLIFGARRGARSLDGAVDYLAAAHVGITAFVCTAFFVFPVGTGRIGYMTLLLLMPLLGAARLQRASEIAAAAVACMSVVYLVVKAWSDGVFRSLLA